MGNWQKMFSTAVNDYRIKSRSVLNLCIGDTVSHDLIDYLVTGQVSYLNNEGHTWTDYDLEGNGYTWLVFERDLDVAAIYQRADFALDGKPPKQIKYQGTVYFLDEFGRAGVTEVNGKAVKDKGNYIKYWQYQDDTGGHVIYVEDCDGRREISCGYCIRPDELRLIRKLRAIY